MKVRALKEFKDLKENVVRMPGDIFTCTKERFEEMKTGLRKFCLECEWVEEVKENGSTKAGKSSTRDNNK
ncbi:MAG: hypothetical protein SOR77_00705 [Peptoniphilus sp.]|uniref:hypothetical protein n=1 Tax=Peptoniphilus sp. TaxID=1971214 RepID=UPI002A752051|nr:hypothetical protein [Peptoniphilus sp.]MDY2986129.1 hypothetical protein [Peptoniphilus sp.]